MLKISVKNSVSCSRPEL